MREHYTKKVGVKIDPARLPFLVTGWTIACHCSTHVVLLPNPAVAPGVKSLGGSAGSGLEADLGHKRVSIKKNPRLQLQIETT